VYHKRRISWSKFFKQVYKFGLARPILNSWHPQTKKITYWFPTLFTVGLLLALVGMIFNNYILFIIYAFYFAIAFVLSLIKNRNISIAIFSIFAILIQFFGYGLGFLKSTLLLLFNNKPAEQVLPNMFFNK